MNLTVWNRVRYSLYAPFYDPVVRLFERGRRRSFQMLSPRPGENLLIVGCGTGLDFALIPPGVHVTAIDLTPAMVERATVRAEKLSLPADVRVMDASHLTFSDSIFDAVVLHLILAVVPDPYACIEESVRVLKPGGRVAVFDKFVPDGRHIGLFRRIVGALLNLLATNINRALEPLLEHGRLKLIRKENAELGGFFVVALAQKPSFNE